MARLMQGLNLDEAAWEGKRKQAGYTEVSDIWDRLSVPYQLTTCNVSLVQCQWTCLLSTLPDVLQH